METCLELPICFHQNSYNHLHKEIKYIDLSISFHDDLVESVDTSKYLEMLSTSSLLEFRRFLQFFHATVFRYNKDDVRKKTLDEIIQSSLEYQILFIACTHYYYLM